MACRLHGFIGNGNALSFGFDFCVLDSLHTEGTLFHDSAGANHDIWIKNHVLQLVGALVIEPVEAADFVSTVIGTISSPDAAVIDLSV